MRLGLFWFFALLFVEIWSIIKMSDYVGGWATLVLLVAGFFFGLQLMRAQGINAMIKASQQAVQSAESPLAPLAEGIGNAFAGILLIIPGFVSDILALIILLPFVRNSFARYLAKKGQFKGFAAGGGFGQGKFSGAFGASSFGKGGFGKPSANDDFARGNVYDHDGGAKVDVESAPIRVLEGEVIALKPRDKPHNPK